MAVLRATQFDARLLTSTSYITLYTVPSGHVIILKSIALRNYATVNNTFNVRLGTAPNFFVKVLGVGGGDTSAYEFRPWIVVGPGQTIQATVSNSTGIGVILSGSILYI